MNKNFIVVILILLLLFSCQQPFQIPSIDMSYYEIVKVSNGEKFALAYRPVNIIESEFKIIDSSGVAKNISGKLNCTSNDNNVMQYITFDVSGSSGSKFDIYFVIKGNNREGKPFTYQGRKVTFILN